MRHRIGIGAITGLGNPLPEMIENTETTGSKERDDLIRACAKECYETFFKGSKERGIDCDGVDAGITPAGDIRIGIEPGYMYWPLKIVEISREKKWSQLMTGYSWGAYGSGLRKKHRRYGEYKKCSKFIRFIDKWHPVLFPKN